MDIRETKPGDYPSVSALVAELIPGTNFSLESVRQEIKGFTAYEGERVTGFLLGSSCWLGLPSENYGSIEILVVAGSKRRSGVGRSLVTAWQSWLSELNIHVGFVSPKAGNAPSAFYGSLGFRDCANGDFMVWVADRT